jgi:hypothetical protein
VGAVGLIKDNFNFASGLAVGGIIAFGAAAVIDGKPSADWATIWAGAAALGGTLIAGWLAWEVGQRQIRAQAQILDTERKARLAAEKASLPDALGRIISLCDVRIAYLISMSGSEPAGEIEASVIETVKACIELATGNAQQQLIDLIAIGSIAKSWESARQGLIKDRDAPLARLLADDAGPIRSHSHHRVTDIFRWAALRARAGNLYRFSYGVQEEPEWSGIQSHFEVFVVHLSEEGVGGGFMLINHPEYARHVEAFRSGEGYTFCRQDWRERSSA